MNESEGDPRLEAIRDGAVASYRGVIEKLSQLTTAQEVDQAYRNDEIKGLMNQARDGVHTYAEMSSISDEEAWTEVHKIVGITEPTTDAEVHQLGERLGGKTEDDQVKRVKVLLYEL
jgi:hypothetical protein